MRSKGAQIVSGGRQGWSYYTDIPAGALAIKHTADLYIYPNTLKGRVVDDANFLQRNTCPTIRACASSTTTVTDRPCSNSPPDIAWHRPMRYSGAKCLQSNFDADILEGFSEFPNGFVFLFV